MTDGSGGVTQCYDYLPFGEEIRQGFNGRGSCYPPSGVYPHTADATSRKFTGKERDIETGLDYFGARYFSAAQGRFTSTDPTFVTKQRIGDPQQWNLYIYTRNNPFKYIDPDGRELKLSIYSGSLPTNVATGSSNYIATTLRNAGLKNVTFELRPGSPSAWDTFRYQMGPTPHSVLLELRSGKAGDPTIPVLESGQRLSRLAGANSYVTVCACPLRVAWSTTDALTTTFSAYDGMNRVTGKSYNDGITPAVGYAYYPSSSTAGCPKLSQGRLMSVTSGTMENTYSCYDVMGRVTSSSQATGGVTYPPFSYVYDKSGALASVTYPSGRVVTNTFDAAGRINQVTGPSNKNYASQVAYAPQGAIQSLTLFNGVVETWSFNPTRQQPTSLQASLGATAVEPDLGLRGGFHQ